MLISFKACNIFSFSKEEICLDFRASQVKAHEYSLINKNNERLLPLVSIYGANASGKTNTLRALRELLNAIVGETHSNLLPFAFRGDEINLPELTLECFIGKNQFKYKIMGIGFKYLFEGLSIKADGKKTYSMVYARTRELIDGPWTIEIGNSNYVKKIREEIKYVADMEQRENNLLLTALGKRQGIPDIKSIYLWAKSAISYEHSSFRDYGQPIYNYNKHGNIIKALEDDNIKKHYLEFLKRVNPSISDIALVRKQEDDNSLNSQQFTISINYDIPGLSTVFNDHKILELVESAGVHTSVKLFPVLYDVLQHGGLLIIDELEQSLHPLLMLDVINMFTAPETNPGCGQIVFTTHNALIMDKKYLRMDEIVFVEKDTNTGVSSLYRLSDIEGVRSDMDFCKRYIVGNFGAIPDYSENDEETD